MAAQNSSNSLPPANGSISWLSEASKVQASISAVSPHVSLNPDTDNIGASDGTTGETAALTSALSKCTIHIGKAATRTASIPDTEKKRINDAMLRADNDILIIVKASVALATGQTPSGKMATTDRAEPTAKDFAKCLEGLLLTTAGAGPGATLNSKRIK